MEISIPVEVELKDSNIDDNTAHYDQTIHREYQKGLRLQDNNEIYERTGDNLLPETYDPTKDATYLTGDVLWTPTPVIDGYGGGNTVNGVLTVAGRSIDEVPMQPELYANSDIFSVGYSLWNERYALIDTGFTKPFTGFSKSKVSGSSTYYHRLYKDATSPTGWTYECSTFEAGVRQWKASEYSKPFGPFGSKVDTNVRVVTKANSTDVDVYVWYHDVLVKSFTTAASNITENITEFIGNNSNIYSGVTFKMGELSLVNTDSASTSITYSYYRISIELADTSGLAKHRIPCNVYDFITNDTIENESYYCISSGPSQANQKDANFVFRSVILRGDKLYGRTAENKQRQTVSGTKPKLVMLNSIEDFLSGWTYVSPIERYKPFDNKNYTKIKTSDSLSFVIDITGGKFNTIAFTGLICDKLSIKSLSDTGAIYLNDRDLLVDGSRDVDKRLPDVPATAIFYNNKAINGSTDAPKGGKVEIMIEGSRIELGNIYIGLSVNAGFTNLEFQNKYKDYSPYEKDQWGNVLYVPGVKTNIHTGTVDIPIRHYDMMNRLMVSLGQGVVILNGSDVLNNKPPDNNLNMFASTFVVGRIRNFQLQTKLDNKHMGDMATYGFTCEEEV